MRKIEQKMIAAILSGEALKSGNTRVSHDPVIGGTECEVRLFGHLIAKRFIGGGWEICLCGYNTATTRSRLSAIVREFSRNGGQGLGVGTKAGAVRLHDARGITEINATDWHKVITTGEPVERTRVVFRKWRDGGVIALFPDEDAGAHFCGSFEHVGQHGGADYAGVIARTSPATPEEFADLRRELESPPYSYALDIRSRR